MFNGWISRHLGNPQKDGPKNPPKKNIPEKIPWESGGDIFPSRNLWLRLTDYAPILRLDRHGGGCHGSSAVVAAVRVAKGVSKSRKKQGLISEILTFFREISQKSIVYSSWNPSSIFTKISTYRFPKEGEFSWFFPKICLFFKHKAWGLRLISLPDDQHFSWGSKDSRSWDPNVATCGNLNVVPKK